MPSRLADAAGGVCGRGTAGCARAIWGVREARAAAWYGVEFNVSHSLDTGVFAFSRHAVGVDIEAIRPVRHALPVAESFFAPSEIAELQRLAPENLDAGFLRCWTRKEAFGKGRGQGLAAPDGDGDRGHWRFFDLDAGPGFVAALAVDCADVQVVQRGAIPSWIGRLPNP